MKNTRESLRLIEGILNIVQKAESVCVNEIAAYVETEFGNTVYQDEKSYRIIHIHSILNETDENN